MMSTLLWLDDERNPGESRWQVFFPIESPTVVWVQDFRQFIAWITENSLPAAICFDHDLGDEPSGLDAARWLTEYCLEFELGLPIWNIQSANPIGKQNIAALLRSFARITGDV